MAAGNGLDIERLIYGRKESFNHFLLLAAIRRSWSEPLSEICKYLRYYGWEPVVYAPSNAAYPYFDETNFKHVPENMTVLKRPIREPFEMFKKLSGRKKEDSANPVYVRDRKRSKIDEFAIWVRGNFFIPDARSMWIKPSVRYLKKWVKENPVDAILTDGPPHTNTVIGCRLSQATGIPWLADFQDPWTQVDYYEMLKIGKRADRIHHKLEQECFRTAKKITIASPTWAGDLESIGAENVDPVFWGYDDDDFPEKWPEADDTFSIVHAGQLVMTAVPMICSGYWVNSGKKIQSSESFLG